VSDSAQGDRIALAARRGRGLGLNIMEHRARMIGASLALRRRRGGGTEVVCEVPMPALQS
jgi:nitrate/nitrite-specific signal transduction histidine kinase